MFRESLWKNLWRPGSALGLRRSFEESESTTPKGRAETPSRHRRAWWSIIEDIGTSMKWHDLCPRLAGPLCTYNTCIHTYIPTYLHTYLPTYIHGNTHQKIRCSEIQRKTWRVYGAGHCWWRGGPLAHPRFLEWSWRENGFGLVQFIIYRWICNM